MGSFLDELYKFMGKRIDFSDPKPVDGGNNQDTLRVVPPDQGATDMANTVNATWVLGNTSPATVASVYYSPGQASTQQWSILPNSGIMSAQPTIMMPYDPFMTDQTGITLIPEPNFTDEQIEEALEYING